MEFCTAEHNIEATAVIAREASFNEKQSFTEQERTNRLLDKMLDFKAMIRRRIDEIEDFIPKMEQLTWYDIADLDKETQKKLNDLISVTKDWSDALGKKHNKWSLVFKDEFSIEELEDFKNAIDDLEEVTMDLEKAVFYYAKDEDFIRISEELKSLT